jgi:hypothetical protein
MLRLLALASLLLLAACNVDRLGQPAPPIRGTTWVRAEGGAEPVPLEGRWTLVEFFSPT